MRNKYWLILGPSSLILIFFIVYVLHSLRSVESPEKVSFNEAIVFDQQSISNKSKLSSLLNSLDAPFGKLSGLIVETPLIDDDAEEKFITNNIHTKTDQKDSLMDFSSEELSLSLQDEIKKNVQESRSTGAQSKTGLTEKEELIWKKIWLLRDALPIETTEFKILFNQKTRLFEAYIISGNTKDHVSAWLTKENYHDIPEKFFVYIFSE